jgi:hypothetical protein
VTESAVVSAAISDWVEAGKPAPTVEVVASVALEAMRRVGLRPADLDAVISTTSAMPFGHPTFLTTPAQHMGHRLAGKMGSKASRCSMCPAHAPALPRHSPLPTR